MKNERSKPFPMAKANAFFSRMRRMPTWALLWHYKEEKDVNGNEVVQNKRPCFPSFLISLFLKYFCSVQCTPMQKTNYEGACTI